MRNSAGVLKALTLASVVLALSVGMADAKKKKPAVEIDCSNVEFADQCADANDTSLPFGAQAEDKNSKIDVASKSNGAETTAPAETVPAQSTAATQTASVSGAGEVEEVDTSEWYVGTMPDKPYDIPLVDRSKMDPKFERQEVAYNGKEPVGSIVVDIDRKFLYFIESEGKAVRYGIGVGRLGFSWRGNAIVGRKGVWPHWTPTETMRKVLPNLPAGMEGGLDSPLGARAMYLYQDGRDIMFRIHGTNEPWSIGEQVSSGCVRLLNEDVADLYERVKIGTQVFVRNSKHGTGMKMPTEDTSG